ncbi:hypothetical protein CHLRE_17g735283v5 [Chlamydomonas reinhardtii]|uniref:Uncharacterized protein n=1 Tax=Chlamydomonas reinhardtii TaxID=3055 RepID=A0A2K3CRC3_CHLRE|nr:uncharacterized protein CHLRE_17g735283v5 [Chlamydomonas reinhardtii]XP_042914990.1 uncharacterized protein CHLRE_17g735283v5 [Chlamydomonas reinhardtii]PNW70831.1 hypothetical protein CHLRE_17g735283v5 [Chlamydomonas reinhardtii]PNW70832.1 hypothetical protein CHLRE_17g735283v5 [Chlamydomonas reinhardtii]
MKGLLRRGHRRQVGRPPRDRAVRQRRAAGRAEPGGNFTGTATGTQAPAASPSTAPASMTRT